MQVSPTTLSFQKIYFITKETEHLYTQANFEKLHKMLLYSYGPKFQ